MEWTDEGFVLGARRHGESAVIVTLLTRSHGRHAGLVRGGAGRRARGLYQPGNLVRAHWRARLALHLGHYNCEMIEARAAALLDDPLRLAVLAAASAVAEAALPEREAHPRAFEGFERLVGDSSAMRSATLYVRWETDLLAELGFGIDLSRCAATGATQDLAYVSPKTGRAVSLAAGARYRDKLLDLPAFLLADAPATVADLRAGLRLTGHFLDQHVFSHLRPARADGSLWSPAARDRLVERLAGA